MTPLHQRLRAATAAAHDRLETLMPLDDDSLTPARYGAALQVLHAVRTGWESGIEAHLPGSTGPHRIWLEADLAHLGLAAIAPAPPLPMATVATAWGASYVLQGSALGSRMLLRRVAPLGFDADRGARYFAGNAEATGPLWRDFLHRMDDAAPDPAQLVDGATTAFDALARFAADRLA